MEQFIIRKSKSDTTIYDPLTVYTDGSCIHNGKKNARAGIGVYFGKGDIRNVSRRIEGKQTNNRAELFAIIKAIECTKCNLVICSDSEYAIKGITGVYNVKKNIDLFDRIKQLSENRRIIYSKIKGHSKCEMNKCADRLARDGANGRAAPRGHPAEVPGSQYKRPGGQRK